MEMIAALVFKLVDGASCEDFKEAGWEGQFVQHDHGLFWTGSGRGRCFCVWASAARYAQSMQEECGIWRIL